MADLKSLREFSAHSSKVTKPSSQLFEFFQGSAQLEQLLEGITDGFFAVDRQWRVIFANKQAQGIAQATLEEVRGKVMWDYIPQYKGTPMETMYHRAMESSEPIAFTEFLPDIQRWFHTSIYPSANGLAIYFRDVTDELHAERQRRESLHYLDLALKGSGISIWEWDVRERSPSAPKVWEELSSYSEAFASHDSETDFRQFIHPDDQERAQAALESYLNGATPIYEVEHRLLQRDGSYRWVLSRGIVLRDHMGTPERLLGILIDITEKRNYSEKLVRLKEALERSNRDLEQFAAIVAHDLKEPLRGVSLNLQLLVRQIKPQVDLSANRYMKDSLTSVNRLAALIDGLLIYSNVDADDLPAEPIHSRSAIEDALKNLSALIRDTNAKTEFIGDFPHIVGRRPQIVQVFQNLLGNAIKFRKKDVDPHVIIEAKRKDVFVEFAIRDNGIGFDPKHCAKIFRIFHRVNPNTDYPGHGIGLAVTKKIVDRHGGHITVDSTPDVGTTFYISLPVL